MKSVDVVPPAEIPSCDSEAVREGSLEDRTERAGSAYHVPAETVQLDSGEKANGILEVMPDGLDLSEVRIIFRERMISMFPRHRSADSI